MLKILERTEGSLLIRVPSLYERDIRNLFKRSININATVAPIKIKKAAVIATSKSKSLFSVKKNIRIIEEVEPTAYEIKVIDEFYKSRLGKVDFSDLRSAREVFEEIKLKRK